MSMDAKRPAPNNQWVEAKNGEIICRGVDENGEYVEIYSAELGMGLRYRPDYRHNTEALRYLEELKKRLEGSA